MMVESDKATAFLAMWAKALTVHNAQKGVRDLGNRSEYLGVSEISRGAECPRAAVASKLIPPFDVNGEALAGLNPKCVKRVLKSQLAKQRGHWVETGMVDALSSLKLPFIYQLEIRAVYKGVPIQAHLDLTFVGRKNVRVVELKSTKRLRNSLFPAYEMQLYAQLGLLKALWNQPAFNVRNDQGAFAYQDCTFPEIAARLLNIELPDDAEKMSIEGWVVSIAPDDMQPYGPYIPQDAPFGVTMESADTLWQWITEIRAGCADLSQVPYSSGYYPLCDWCDHNGSCPKFAGQAHSEYADTLQRRADLKQQIRILEEEVAELDEHLKFSYRHLLAGQAIAPGEWVMAGDTRFRVLITANQVERLYVGTVNPEPPLDLNPPSPSGLEPCQAKAA